MKRQHNINILETFDNTLKKRFFNKVEYQPDGCHKWIGAKSTKGSCTYGYFNCYGVVKTVHRIAWVLANQKEIPEDMCILHRCDNPLCVSPDHLFLGTQQDNVKDMVNKERFGNSAKLTNEDVKDIYALYDKGLNLKEISKLYNVVEGTIWKIVSGIRRKNLFVKNKRTYQKIKRLTDKQLNQICCLLYKGNRISDIARRFNIDASHITKIKYGDRHKNLYKNYVEARCLI